MSTKVKLSTVFLVAAFIGGAAYWWWVHDAPRRQSLDSLTRLDAGLHSANRTDLLQLLVIPAAVQGRTKSEQSEFLVKALTDEISPEGLAVLRKHGDYGPLRKLFPAEAEAWAKSAGVIADDCVAFKLERNGLRAEVILLNPSRSKAHPSASPPTYRVVRINNLRQLADPNLLTAKKTP